MPEDQTTQQNPVDQYPQEVPEQELEHPGLESQMDMRPDYGEETYRGSGRLTGKAAIVTGGDSGIGRAVALAFAREGADVLISYLEEEESDARDTVRIVQESGKKAVPVPGDIRNESHCQRIVDQAVQEFGKIDVLVNNAAYQMVRNGIQEISSDSSTARSRRTSTRCSTCARLPSRTCNRVLPSSTPPLKRLTTPNRYSSTTLRRRGR
jgi:hypothetical protein